MIQPSDNPIYWIKLQLTEYSLAEKGELTEKEIEWFRQGWIPGSKLEKINE